MHKKRKHIRINIACLIFLMLIGCLPMRIYAANATVTFGSESYEGESGGDFPVGIYIRGDTAISQYHIEIKYDEKRLRYTDDFGNNDEENGILTFDGTTSSDETKLWLTFEALSGGMADIQITSATALTETGENFDIENLQNVQVNLSGEDTVGEVEEEQSPMEQVTETVIEATENITDISSEEQTETEESNTEVFMTTENTTAGTPVWKIGLGIIVGFLLLFAVIFFAFQERKSFKDKKKKSDELQLLDLSKEELENNIKDSEEISSEDVNDESDKKKKKPIIKVDDVSMVYKTPTLSTSGIKEYIIQLIKHQVNYRTLKALDHVSFDIYRGEIVGIIGTNGSGKSTLLKIISGALNPSSGEVVVDKKKIQLLTLGAGFDMELSAKENVYLNGAIIGYTKEFIDLHYDEIVSFAELDGFMDEKVKNFSSGMVSRLGFAIATVGDAAEILILDEVLSVGDEFFRKKSLSRVQELIHGGSTVLMVSHGIGTILKNCTKVVWIEKGKLQMVGNPDIVCAAYRSQHN